MSNGGGFPTSGQFAGAYVPNDSAAQWGGQSTYDGSIAVTLFERAIVEPVLPPGFSLAARTDGATTHPVIHMIGHQRNPMLLEDGFLIPALDLGYKEMTLLIPYVVANSGTMWHTFVVRMFLDDIAAIDIGNSWFAYQKEFAALPETDAPNVVDTDVMALFNGDVFSSAVTQNSQWTCACDAPAVVPSWRDVQTLFAMPIVGVDVDPTSGHVTRILCSYWEWDYANVYVAAASSQHDFVRICRPGMGGWVGPCSSPSGGALMIRGLRWRLADPPTPTCQF